MYELTTTNNRVPRTNIRAERGRMAKLPGGVRMTFDQGRDVAVLTMSNDDAARLVKTLTAFLPKPEVAA